MKDIRVIVINIFAYVIQRCSRLIKNISKVYANRYGTSSLENYVGMCQPTTMTSISIKGLSGPVKSKSFISSEEQKFSVVFIQENLFRSAIKIFESKTGLNQDYHNIIESLG